MRRRRLAAAGLLGALAAVGAAASLFVVGQGSQAVVLRLGRPAAVINAPGPPSAGGPGLYAKLPFADRVVRLGRGDLALAPGVEEVVLGDQGRLEVQPVMHYRILAPLSFYQATGGGGAAGEGRLKALLDAALRQALGGASLHDVTTGRRAALMGQVRDTVARAAQVQRLGVQVSDVRLLRADLSDADAQYVYRRMAAGEAQQAAQIRSQGEQRKRDLMAAADRDAALIRAGADGQAVQIRDRGEAERAAILAKAHGQDPAFARFQDTLAAYRATLGRGDTTLVLTPGSGFLRDLAPARAVGAGGKPGAARP